MQLRKQKGFTLVEIAIVLVIVGLLIGGVLKGQEMITSARLKRVESDNAGIAAAMFSYQDRYQQLPGDDSQAKTRFDVYTTPTATGINGDGDGVIDGAWLANAGVSTELVITDNSVESQTFFSHLKASGLIPGGGMSTVRPTHAYGGRIGIQDGSLGILGHVTLFAGLDGVIAKIIDTRLDDSSATAGRIRASTSAVMASGDTGIAYADTARYNIAFRL